MRPQVTVVVPTANRSSAILATLASVQAQTLHDWELVVVDDGSTDDTVEVVRSLGDDRVRLVEAPARHHPGPGRDLGIRLASAPLVAYLDHDDAYDPDHLADAVGRARASDGAVWASGCRYVDAGGVELHRSTALDAWWHPELQALGPVFEPTRVVHRTPVVAAVGGWRCDHHALEDWDLWDRLAGAGHRFEVDPACTVAIERGGSSRLTTLRARFTVPLLVTDRPEAAEAAVADAGLPAAAARLSAAVADDTVAWFEALRHDPGGWLGAPLDVDDVRAALLAHPDRASRLALLVRPHRTGAAISVALPVARRGHALRAGAVLRRRRTRATAVLAELVREAGGRILGGATGPGPVV